MKIRCWGARGSIPVSGPDYLEVGGDTCCLEIRDRNGAVLVVDAGSGIRRLGKKLVEERAAEISIVLTHAHWDHINGFPFFLPLYRPGTRITFYGCPFAQRSIGNVMARTMEPPYFPVRLEDVRAELTFTDLCRTSFAVGGISVDPVLLSHPDQGLGYRFTEQGKTFVFLTDNELSHRHPGGLSFDDYLEFCRGVDLLFHDCEFTQEEYPRRAGWGHSHHREALELALQADVGAFGLFHHQQERSDREVAALVADCAGIAAARGSRTRCFAVTQETEIEL